MPKPKKVDYNASQVIDQTTAANKQAGQDTFDISKQAAAGTQDYAKLAAMFNLSQNTMDQENPYGNTTYESSIDPITGVPKYKVASQLSPDQQMILDFLEQNKQIAGGTAGQLASNTFDQYTKAPDLIGSTNSLTQQALDKMMPAWERFDKPAREQLDTQLRNSGILPGTPAYHQMVDKLQQQQDLDRGQWLANYTPQAFEMASKQRKTPLDEFMALMNAGGGPADLKGQMLSTPTANMGGATVSGATINPADVAGISKTAADVQIKNQEMQNAYWNSIISGVGSVAGGVAGMPVNPENMTFGGQMLKNMFLKS